jgi:signal transduction histidine kinase
MEVGKRVRTEKRSDVFFENVAKVSLAGEPHLVFDRLCELWHEALNPAWVWLWQRNQYTKHWEPLAVGPDDFKEQLIPDPIEKPSCVADLSIKTLQPVRIPDVSTFYLTDGEDSYRLHCRELLLQLHCQSCVIVPLSTTEIGTSHSASNIEVVGAISLHYRHELINVPSDSELMAMARLTTSKIIESYQNEYFRLLVELNSLESRYVPQITKTPDVNRRSYLKELASLIKKRIHTHAVSIFYRVPFEEQIECLYTDGLVNNKGERVSRSELSNVTYAAGECRTGRVFADNQPLFLEFQRSHSLMAKYMEASPKGHPLDGPSVMFPIPRSDQDGNCQADGVIRCVGHPRRLNQEQSCNFDALEAQTVSFIAQQISPVLHVLATRIQREDTINILKHDLLVPAGMIQDTLDKLIERQQISPASGHAANDLLMCSQALVNLILQLDAEPTNLVPQLAPTMLMGDVVSGNISMLRHYALKEKGMKIDYSGFEFIPKLMIDRQLVGRVIYNLVINAVKYGSANTTINICAGSNPYYYFVDVSNQGIGICDKEAPRIFDRYFQGRIAKKEKVGAGLGLYIAKASMQAQGADVILANGDKPTTFRLTFPRSMRVDY